MTESNSVGDMLRAAREQKGLTLGGVNQATKISENVLRALEQDDFDAFESDIYLKGFIKSYAEFLNLNSRDVVRALDSQRGGVAAGARGTLWDIEETVSEVKIKSPRIFRRIVLPLLIILILMLAILFVNERRKVNRLTTDKAETYLRSEAPLST